jgi:serine phosphatase RsbU (regulator of sigma subunit)/serine/threonine protein kinase
VIAALEEYAAAVEAGQAPDRDAFQARHPEIAAILGECLDGLEWIRAAVPGPSAAAPTRDPAVAGVEPGTPLGDFQIIREIGRGGMGVVYEAEQVSLGRRVALKVLPLAAALDPRQLQRFHNEARAAAGLHHTNIVPVYAVGQERGVHYYAMQLIEGQTLAARIGALRRQAGRDPAPAGGSPAPPSELATRVLSEDPAAVQAGGDPRRTGPDRPEAAQTGAGDPTLGSAKPGSSERSLEAPGFFLAVAQLGIQAAEALEHAHQRGVMHRDVKPGNLLVEGELGAATPRVRLWVTDFGLAHCRSQAGLTMTGDLAGTPRYMSPEQALARPVPIDHRTDIYSLGVTLYELLTLEPVFPGRDREELLRQIAIEEPRPLWRLNRAIPTELENIVLRAMAKNPADRYATAQELADDLERFLKDEPIRANLLIQQALNAILRISLEPISLDEQLDRVLGLILELPWLALERKGSIYLADEEAQVLVRKAQVGMPAGALSACARVPFGTCLCGQAIVAGEVVFASCLDARHTIRYPGMVPHGHYCVPIGSGERPIGLLTLYVREGHQWLAREEHFLRAVADVLAGIIERQQTQERLREQLRLAAFGRDVGLALSQGDRLSDVLRRCAEAMVRDLEGVLARIWTLNEAENVLELRAGAGLNPPTDGAHGRVPVGRSEVGLIARERKPHLTNAVLTDPRVPDHEWARREGLVAFAGYPLLVEDRLVGVMALFARQPLSEATRDALASAASGIAVGIKRLQADRELLRQEADCRIARAIQQGLVPKAMPTLAGFQIAGRLATAEQVGGDCFDFVPMPHQGRERLGVLVADASGHGIAAALLMAQTRAYLRALALTGSDVGTLLALTNRLLARDLVLDHFVTLLLVELDPLTRSLVYASAGHCPGYVLDRQGQIKAVLPSTGTALGIDPASEFQVAPALALAPGDLVFAYTDGIPEAMSAAGQSFGVERALAVIRAHRHETPEAILEGLVQAVTDFTASHVRLDDITAVLIKAEEGA